MHTRIQKLCVTALGIALFAVLSLCLQVPVFENYYLCLGYTVVAVYCFSFGAVSGTAVAVLGVIAYCLVIHGLRGMPGWAAGNVVIGMTLGLVFPRTRRMKSAKVRPVVEIAVVILSVTAGILGIKSITESLLYSQPIWARIGKNVYAWAADLFVLIVSLPLCRLLDPAAKKLLYEPDQG